MDKEVRVECKKERQNIKGRSQVTRSPVTSKENVERKDVGRHTALRYAQGEICPADGW